MRDQTHRAARPPRPHAHDTVSLAHRTGPGMAPWTQPAAAIGAGQQARVQSSLDAVNINLYRDHGCLHAPMDGPPDTAKC
ncbi:hypothetical protein GCM10027456_59860 [Kineosporia babensis]